VVLMLCLLRKATDFFSVLVYLEALVIVVFMISVFVLSSTGNRVRVYLLVTYLCFGVCEAVVGLSLLVGAARGVSFYKGNSFSVLNL